MNEYSDKKILISIVSHGQGYLIADLLKDINKLNLKKTFSNLKIIITLNTPEDESFLSTYNGDLEIIRNNEELGFGANHNQAFNSFDSDYFLVLNPDIRISKFDLFSFIEVLDSKSGCCAPMILNKFGKIDDSVRRYPSIKRIIKRVIFNKRTIEYKIDDQILQVEWVAGMFILFNSSIYKSVNGFDTRFFMYLEDADICRRINNSGYKVLYASNYEVIHEAQRQSHKNIKHTAWHVISLLKFFFKWGQ